MGSVARVVGDRLRQMDFYPKTLEDFRIKTISGGAATIVALGIMWLLFLSEFYSYLTPQITEDLFVDTTRGTKLKINLDVVFPRIPCNMLSLDAMDLSGEQHVNIQHNIYKRRLNLEGSPIQDPERQEKIGHEVMNSTKEEKVEKKEEKAVAEVTTPKCGSCYGTGRDCCNTCDEVKDAYRTKGWALPPLKDIEQCVNEGQLVESSELPEEGCQIYGYLEVNRVGGNFHLAPGKSFQHHHLHIHDVQQFRTADFDLSHRIRHLSFGVNIPGKTNPFDGTELRTEKGPKSINYYVKIVPTTYERIDGSTLLTNQFSVTQHQKDLQMGLMGEGGLPGVFFQYELSPMMVKYSEKQRSLGHFLTAVCSIIGGVFTVAGLIHSASYSVYRKLQRKVEIGKAS